MRGGNTFEQAAAPHPNPLPTQVKRVGRGDSLLSQRWLNHLARLDQAVQVLSEFALPIRGICRGVNDDGALLLEVNGTVQVLLSGEVSLRPPGLAT